MLIVLVINSQQCSVCDPHLWDLWQVKHMIVSQIPACTACQHSLHCQVWQTLVFLSAMEEKGLKSKQLITHYDLKFSYSFKFIQAFPASACMQCSLRTWTQVVILLWQNSNMDMQVCTPYKFVQPWPWGGVEFLYTNSSESVPLACLYLIRF